MATLKFKDLKTRELQNKMRSIKDLVNYVGVKPPSHPNYSIFLGAGASVTSGIKSGGHLVDEWRKEIYEQLRGDYYQFSNHITDALDKEIHAKNNAIDFLIKDHGVWYNPQNEYSSLFERKFDLPSQRRRFVENLVDGHLPSIGYLFLITLINNYYFNTIFTTNFDDLINEAFYQFSNTRPFVCAHDSAVSSGLSVISKRPKIIKLHGDYLFDDIKNTMRETESLEHNIREKFIEYTKENGLIIVGYSGQDRSILDVLNHLLQQEEYLKNGLYWCFRPDDEISHEVRKILWKDKVYCVEIEGFDELFTEFCHHVDLKPDLIGDSIESKRETCIRKFIENYQKCTNKHPLIGDFIDDVLTIRNNQDVSDLIRQLNENKNSNLSTEKLKGLLEIENLINKKDLENALVIIEERLKENLDEELEENYNSLKIKVFQMLGKNQEAIRYIDELIIKDEFNNKYPQLKIMLISDLKDKISYIKTVIDKIDYSFSLKNSFVKNYIEYHDENPDHLLYPIEECEKYIEESFNLDASLDNDAYLLKYDLINLKKRIAIIKDKKNNLKKDIENTASNEKKNLINTVKKINSYHSVSIKLTKFYVIESKDVKLIYEYIDDLTKMMEKVSKDGIKNIINIIADLYYNLIIEDKSEYLNNNLISYENIDLFFNNYIGNKYKNNNIPFLIKRMDYILTKKTDIKEVINILNEILNSSDSINYIDTIFSKFTMLNKTDINNRLSEFLTQNKININLSSYYYCTSEIESSNKNYNNAFTYLDKYYNIEKLEGEEIVAYSYALLLAKEYKRVQDFINKQDYKITTCSKNTKNAIQINFLSAKKLENGELTPQEKAKLEDILAKSSEIKKILICANSLLGKNSEAMHHIKKILKLNYKFKYELLEWPAINEELKKNILEFSSALNKPNISTYSYS